VHYLSVNVPAHCGSSGKKYFKYIEEMELIGTKKPD
jgi:hypothetical protein